VAERGGNREHFVGAMKYRLRLIYALPIVVACFTLAAGFFPLGLIESDMSPNLSALRLVVVLIALAATALTVAITSYILRPVERITRELKILGEEHHVGTGVPENQNEIEALSNLYSQTLVPLKGYLNSADLFMQMSEGVIGVDRHGEIVLLNAPVEHLFGIRKEKYLGKKVQDLFPDSTKNIEIHDMIREALQQWRIRTRDLVVSTAAGRDVYVRATASPAMGEKHEHTGVVILFRDFEEFGRLRDQLRRMDALAALGGTVAGMAHEVRTPLGYIRSLADLLAEDIPKEAPQRRYVSTIVESVDRLSTMVEQILSLSRVRMDVSAQQNPVTLVRESLAYARDLLQPSKLSLVEEYPEAAYLIKGDRDRLIECFINLFRNACEASPEGARVTVRVRPVQVFGESEDVPAAVIIEFHNEGSYIPPENVDKIFVPFFTTKKQGTGLGLAITRQIIEGHDGAIHVESDPQKGTLFRVLLPTTRI
jgi:PAS domain S-box-containing protein